MNFLSPVFNEQTFDANGDPLVGGKVYTYAAGTSTPLQTYTTQNGVVQHSNPIILDARGEPPSPIWLLGSGQEYKFQLHDANDNLIRTIDDVGGVNDVTVSNDEWQTSSLVPTYINGTSFSVVGDQTLIFSIGRRVRTENTGGTIYSTITNSVFGAGITTITISNDSGNLDSGLSLVSYGILSPVNPSLPDSAAARTSLGITVGVQVFDTAGAFTYTPTSGTRFVFVEVVGGGGGSGGCAATAAGQVSMSGGGGSGAYAKSRIASGFSGAAVVVGAAGAAGAAAGNGGNGGQSSFDTVIAAGGAGSVAGIVQTAPGGQGGGAGGVTPSVGNIVKAAGCKGDIAYSFTISTPIGGTGGNSFFGGGGTGGGPGAVGFAGNAPGSGAGGSSNLASSAARVGAVGSAGIVIVYEYS